MKPATPCVFPSLTTTRTAKIRARTPIQVRGTLQLSRTRRPSLRAKTRVYQGRCTALCCSTADNAFQPTDKKTLAGLTKKRRNFQPHWFKRFPWLSVCTTDKKVYCICCKYATKHRLISFSKMGGKAFTEDGFQNWKKAVEKFSAHSSSQVHWEANLKWMARGKPTIESQLASQLAKAQMIRRQGLMLQLRAIVFPHPPRYCHPWAYRIGGKPAPTNAGLGSRK